MESQIPWPLNIFLCTIFLFRLSCFPRGLAGVAFFYEDYVCSLVFCKNSSSGGNSFFSLACSKHPADVIKRKGQGTRRQHVLSEVPRPLSFKRFAFFEQSKCKDTNPPSNSNSLPKHQTQSYRNESHPGAAGKALNVGERKSGAKGIHIRWQIRNFDYDVTIFNRSSLMNTASYCFKPNLRTNSSHLHKKM